jgi:dTDP-4-dehydrorhamnose reductase
VRVLVTGGTGYLGRVIVDRFGARDDDVHALWHRTPPASQEDVTWHPSELADDGSTGRLVERLQPDLVVHTAYSMTTDADVVNGSAPGELAAASRAASARFVHLSTDVVFDGSRAEGGYREDDAVHPITPYGRAKAHGERLVRDADPDALILRTSLLYGGAQPGPQERLVTRALDGDDIAFFTDELRSVVQVDDLADAVVELADRPISGVLHVAGADAVSRFDFARLLARASGHDADRLRGASSVELDPPRPRNCALDSSLARSLLSGTRLRGAHEVLAEP